MAARRRGDALGAGGPAVRRAPHLRAGRADAVARSAAALGAARFAELFAGGQRQPLAATVAFALDETRDPDQDGDAQTALAGRLTAREQEIAVLVADGLTNRQIAEKLFISRRTVDAHLEHIFGKLGITSRVMLAIQRESRSRQADGRSAAESSLVSVLAGQAPARGARRAALPGRPARQFPAATRYVAPYRDNGGDMAGHSPCGTACMAPGRNQRIRRADSGAAPHRQAAARHSPGHADRPRRRRQDPHRAARRRRGGAQVPGRGLPRRAVRAARPRAAAAHGRAQARASEHARDSQRDALLAHLRDRRLLLILDTCEHLIDACAELAEEILLHAPSVTVLAASREPLDVDGETTFPVRPLPVTGAEGNGEDPHPVRCDGGALAADPAAARGPSRAATPSSCSHGGPPPRCPGSR